MRILNFMCCWNEIEYIPKCIKFYQQHGIDVVVADNHSDDGSWEWLNDNNVKCFQFDTGGAFTVKKQQALRGGYVNTHREYDWIIYGDSDEYPATEKIS
jgi:glycosyltransferase involved in cell wall biosynthesis